jgi:hypothetical protein
MYNDPLDDLRRRLDDLRREVDALGRRETPDLAAITPTIGTWTPVITAASSDPTVTYTTQVGNYFKLGDWVWYQLTITINTIAGGSGNVHVSLPFTVAANNFLGAARSVGVDVSASAINLTLNPVSGNAYGRFTTTEDNAAATVVAVADLAHCDTLAAAGFFTTS